MLLQTGMLALVLLSATAQGNNGNTTNNEWSTPDFTIGYPVGGPDAHVPFCPPDALAVQNPVAAGGTWYYTDLEYCNPSNSAQCQRTRADSFPPLAKPIGTIRFEGANLDRTATGCTKKDDRFRIRLYAPGANPDPNNWLYSEDDPFVSKVFTRQVQFTGGLAPADAFYYTIALAEPQDMPNGGFVSIVGQGDPHCWFLWAGSNEGDLCVWSWWGTNIPGTFQKQCTSNHDVNYCIQAIRSGACCDDRTGICVDRVEESKCLGMGGHFTPDKLCAELNPPCRAGIGACCGDDPNDCRLTTYLSCEGPDTTGYRWLGRGTTCAQCCTIAVGTPTENEPDKSQCGCCPGDANCDGYRDFGDINPFVEILNGRPPCQFCNLDVNGDGVINFGDINPFVENLGLACDAYPDNYNRGCAGNPDDPGYPKTLPITPGTPIYGELGTYKIDGREFRDEDWYRFTAAGNTKFTFEVESEVPVEALIALAGTTCDSNQPNGFDLFRSEANAACPAKVVVTTPCLPAGPYYFIVRPANFERMRCGMDYRATLTAVSPCTPCTVTCTGYREQEACGEDRNGGCDSTPHRFELLPPNTTTICGSVWARNGRRDSDWYGVRFDRPGQSKWVIDSEVPVRATFAFDFSNQVVEPPDPNHCDQLWMWSGTFTVTDPNTGCEKLISPDLSQYVYPPGTYFFVVRPDRQTGGVFHGYPCAQLNEYRLNLEVNYFGVPCTGANVEDEEITAKDICRDNWVDTRNGGCDAGNFDLMQDVAIDDRICGQTGTYRVGGELRRDYDWYRLPVPTLRKLSIGARGNFPLVVEIYEGNFCGELRQLDSFELNRLGLPEFDTHVTACLKPQAYYLRVFVNDREGDHPCGDPNDPNEIYGLYALDIITDVTCGQTCEVECSGGPDELCGEKPDRNLGCDKDHGSDPNSFMVFAKGVEYCGRIYDDSLFDPNGWDRDVDWFKFTVPTNQVVTWTVKSDFRVDLEIFRACGLNQLHYITFDRRDAHTVAIPQTTTCGAITRNTDNNGQPIQLTSGTYVAVLTNLYVGGMPCRSDKVEYTIRWD